MAGSKLSDLASELATLPDAARIYIVHNNTSQFMTGLKLKELLSTWSSLSGSIADNSAITSALDAKIDKVAGATNLAVAILNTDGEVVDGVIKLADLLTKNTTQIITGSKTFLTPVLASKGSRPDITADYTLELIDSGSRRTTESPNDINITVPPQNSEAWNSDAEIEIIRSGAGEVEFFEGSGVILRSVDNKRRISAINGAVRLWRKSTNIWMLHGNLY